MFTFIQLDSQSKNSLYLVSGKKLILDLCCVRRFYAWKRWWNSNLTSAILSNTLVHSNCFTNEWWYSSGWIWTLTSTWWGHHLYPWTKSERSSNRYAITKGQELFWLKCFGCYLLVSWIFKVATALDALASIGLIHGDLHPSNIMVSKHLPEPLKVKVIDFGTAFSVSKAEPVMSLQIISFRWDPKTHHSILLLSHRSHFPFLCFQGPWTVSGPPVHRIHRFVVPGCCFVLHNQWESTVSRTNTLWSGESVTVSVGSIFDRALRCFWKWFSTIEYLCYLGSLAKDTREAICDFARQKN